MKLSHTSAICRTLASADRFYQEVLGLEPQKEFSIDAALTRGIFGQECPCRIRIYGNEDFTVEVFIPELPAPAPSPYAHLCLEVGKLAPFLERCQGHGVTINQVPKGEKLLTFIKDFDGNIFEIKGE